MKFKKIMSAALTAAMVFSMSVVPASASETNFVPTEDGTYTSTKVEAFNYYTPDNYSMCNGVFAGEVDLTIDGDWATLELYVCNPTPTWGGLETGILSDSYITYDGVQYDGVLTSIGYTDADAVSKLYTQEGSFFGIVADTSYTSDTMKFVIPTEALASNIDISAHVNLVMDSKQSFWLDIAFVEPVVDVVPDVVPDSTVDTQEVPVYGTVLSNESTFTVTVPSEITFGDLNTNEDTTASFDVLISNFIKGNDNASVQVVSEDGVITDGTNTIAFANSFGTQSASDNETLSGVLTVKAADVTTATVGEYAGTVTFAISTVK